MKGRLILILAVALAVVSCNLIENLIKIPIRVNSGITIPAGTGVGILTNIFSDETQTDLENELEINDSRLDRLKSVELRECVLTITSPSNGDFSFLNKIDVYLSDDELGDILIASKDNIPNDAGNSIALSVEGDDLVDYLRTGIIKLKTSVVTDEVLLSDYDINVFTRFRVTADIF